MRKLPEPDCKYGYTQPQIEEVMGDRLDDFYRWMGGQTVMLCQAEDPDCSIPHGVIVYDVDVRHFLAGRRPLD